MPEENFENSEQKFLGTVFVCASIASVLDHFLFVEWDFGRGTH